MVKIIFSFIVLFFSSITLAQNSLTFGVVPQQSASKLAKLWSPIIQEIALQSGIEIKFSTAPDIPTFQKRLISGEYDIAYMNPYHYIVFNQSTGYKAFAKARDKMIKGIIVVHKDSPITSFNELNNKTLAFPAPAAFAATILTQSDLSKNKVNFRSEYVSSHDSVYRTVAKGIYPAGGGVLRTFNNVDPSISSQLRILSTTKGYTPHAIAAHPRIEQTKINKIQKALTMLEQSESGKTLLNSINIKGFEKAKDSDWDDIRKLTISVKVVK